MTPQEAIAMQGTEFTYVFENGDTMQAYVKKVDIEKEILSCWSFSLTTDRGHVFKPLNDDEEAEQACCICFEIDLIGLYKTLKEIKEDKKVYLDLDDEKSFCPFSGCPL